MKSLAALKHSALRTNRRLIALSTYTLVTATAYLLAYLLRFELRWPATYTRLVLISLPVLLAIRLAGNMALRLSAGRWRFVSTLDVLRLAAATTFGTAVFFVVTRIAPPLSGVPRSVILLEWCLTTFMTAGVWIAYRTIFEAVRHHRAGFNGSARRVLLVGAGEAGSLLAREMRRLPTGYRVVAFVDDDTSKWGTTLHGAQVIGGTRDLAAMAASVRAQEIVIAIPSASPSELRRLVERCEEAQLTFKVLPGMAEVLRGEVRLNQVRAIGIEDLLGREPVELELPELERDLQGRSILITGAAGSIGSELARQVALHNPGTLILFDQAETPLFYLDFELRERHPGLDIVPIVGDVVDSAALEDVLRKHAPARIFHAAAYKHVPMMETNGRAAIRNNVLGTWKVAEAAGRHGVEKFVLVSTDKAVRPANVMGATKRLAELIILELQERFPGTVYSAVRFGNVLGSSGSVLAIFKRQLELGRPLTLTHPDATRYFMTIPEAVQLILQASLLMSLPGTIAMLDMGEPVRILDLARNFQRLAGRDATLGQGIIVTGLRPGERLHEQLVAGDEETVPTPIAKVRLVCTNRDGSRVLDRLPAWQAAMEQGQDALVFAAFRALFLNLETSMDDAEDWLRAAPVVVQE